MTDPDDTHMTTDRPTAMDRLQARRAATTRPLPHRARCPGAEVETVPARAIPGWVFRRCTGCGAAQLVKEDPPTTPEGPTS